MSLSNTLQRAFGLLTAGTAIVATGMLLYEGYQNFSCSPSPAWSSPHTTTIRDTGDNTPEAISKRRRLISDTARGCFERAKRIRHEDHENEVSTTHSNSTTSEDSNDVRHLGTQTRVTNSIKGAVSSNDQYSTTTDEELTEDDEHKDVKKNEQANNGDRTDQRASREGDYEHSRNNRGGRRSRLEEQEEAEEDDHSDYEDHDEEENDLEAFQPVMAALKLKKLEQFALLLRMQHIQARGPLQPGPKDLLDLSCEIYETPMSGAFNLAYRVDFSDDVTWIARVPGHGTKERFGDLDAEKMNAEYSTMRYIKSSTCIPIPEVYHWEASCDRLGTPFALLSFAQGRPLCEVWDNDLSIKQRLSVLSSIAEYMLQLRNRSFDRKGMLTFDESGVPQGVGQEIVLEPLNFVSWYQTTASGPFDNMSEVFENFMDEAEAEGEDLPIRQRANIRLMCLAVNSIPGYLMSDRRFVLSPCDFNYQNIMVDTENGCCITGFIDWYNVATESATCGYARFPSFITRDWDPAMYNYDKEAVAKGEESLEESPEMLSKYRQHYAAVFEQLASTNSIDDYDPRYTELSHIMEALCISITNSMARPPIMSKLIDHAFDGNTPFTKAQYGNDFEAGDTSEKDALIKKAFATMWHAEWKPKGEASE